MSRSVCLRELHGAPGHHHDSSHVGRTSVAAEGRIHLNLWPETIPILGISMFALLAVRRRRIQALVPVRALALLLLLFAAGCGGAGGGTPNPNGTPVGSYSITVTGTSGGTTQTTRVTLNVT